MGSPLPDTWRVLDREGADRDVKDRDVAEVRQFSHATTPPSALTGKYEYDPIADALIPAAAPRVGARSSGAPSGASSLYASAARSSVSGTEASPRKSVPGDTAELVAGRLRGAQSGEAGLMGAGLEEAGDAEAKLKEVKALCQTGSSLLYKGRHRQASKYLLEAWAMTQTLQAAGYQVPSVTPKLGRLPCM